MCDVALFATPLMAIITVRTSGVNNQSAAFNPYPDVGPVYIKTKRLQLRRDTLTRDQGSYTFEAPLSVTSYDI